MNKNKTPRIDSNGQERSFYLYFLPWLKLEKTVRINQLALIPFPSKVSEAELEGEHHWVYKRLKVLLKSYQDLHNKSAQGFTFIAGPESPCVSVNDRGLQRLFNALELTLNILEFRYLDYQAIRRNRHQWKIQRAIIYPDNEEIFSLSRDWFHESWTPLSELQILKYEPDNKRRRKGMN